MQGRESAILKLIQYRASAQGFDEDMRLVGEAVAIRALNAGASAHRAVAEGIQASQRLARASHHKNKSLT